ncbi:Major facilitator superfamily and Major facilitator superfamily domain, general substrate transporter-containing protein [Strongyloides ratti]|uniref:Major facilitator superfamily and Major facilitator superfamily domain, general substrate transporter-containing protein n=1 Tax=Strongyloides ratti TaxID=34506 RepID=A0A090MVV8_STRRB|nr:Major facilitator superfamily and Major facilitator superfamily domain, general substrate transporter-containing protein [Strongyloides ratti]CEF63153.1 Major facilitator superfamily and Major facilitator superfamily domain, general substrate transporter-containing protein [Strongyloides ratti]
MLSFAKKTDPVAHILMKLSPKLRLSIIICGAVLIHLSLGTYHTFGNMLPYMASYMKNYTNPSIKIEHMIWIPTFQGCFPFAMIIGGYLSLYLTPRIAIGIGCFIMSLGVFLSSYTISYSFNAFFITYGIMFGLGQGIAYVTTVAVAINWAPNNVGLVSGIVAGGFGISSSIFAPIQTELINPKNLETSKNGYFTQQELLQNVPNVFFKLSIAYIIMQCIGLIVMCNPPVNSEELNEKQLNDPPIFIKLYDKITIENIPYFRDIQKFFINNILYCFSIERQRFYIPNYYDDRYNNIMYTYLNDSNNNLDAETYDNIERENDEILNQNETETSSTSSLSISSYEESKNDDSSMIPSKVLKSSTFYLLFMALFCCSFYGNFYYNFYKTFGETFISNDKFFAYAFSVGSIANAIARIGWGLLTDMTSFQVTMSIASFLSGGLLLTMPLTKLFGQYIYFLWLILMFICLAATHALFITAIVKCFGPKYKATNYGFLILSTTLSGILLSLTSQYFLADLGYTWIFIFVSLFPFTTFILTLLVQLTPQGKKII